MSTVIVDTNLFVYQVDPRDPAKQRDADRLLNDLQASRSAVITTQVLGEFFRVVTRRLDPPIPPAEAVELLEELAQGFPCLPIDLAVVFDAARGVCDYQLPYWDAQLWATARRHGIRTVLSEDFADGRVIEGVTFRNPFQSGLSLS